MMPSSAICSIGAAARSAGPGNVRSTSGHGVAIVGAEARGEPTRERSRGGDRHLLAEDGAHRELEGVDAAGQAQPRLARQADERRGDRLGAASRSSQRRTAAITAPLARPSAGANARWTRAASVAKRASIQPGGRGNDAGADAAPDRSRPSVTSTPGIARWSMNAISGATSNGAR